MMPARLGLNGVEVKQRYMHYLYKVGATLHLGGGTFDMDRMIAIVSRRSLPAPRNRLLARCNPINDRCPARKNRPTRPRCSIAAL